MVKQQMPAEKAVPTESRPQQRHSLDKTGLCMQPTAIWTIYSFSGQEVIMNNLNQWKVINVFYQTYAGIYFYSG